MKHLIAGLLILTLTLALCLGATGLLGHYTGQPLQELQLARQAIREENLPNALDCAKNAQAAWDRRSHFYGVVLHERQTEEVDVHFARLLAAAQAGNAAEFLLCCDELIFLIHHLPQMERAHYANIL